MVGGPGLMGDRQARAQRLGQERDGGGHDPRQDAGPLTAAKDQEVRPVALRRV